MDNLEIQESVDGFVIIHDKLSNRYFRFDYPKKFNQYGFGRLNTKETLLPRLMAKDFAFGLSSSGLYIQMILYSSNKTLHFEVECEEIFPDSWINLNLEQLEPNVLMYINSLQSRVNNLNSKLEQMEERIKQIEEKNTYYY